MGLTIFPINKPNLIHSLFSGRKTSGFIKEVIKKKTVNPKKIRLKIIKLIQKKYNPVTINTAVKKKPKLLFDGNLILLNLIVI